METPTGDVVAEILLRLPVKSVMKFRCVCKLWKELTNEPSFIKDHLERARSIHQPHSNFIISNLPISLITIQATPLFHLAYDQTLQDYTCNVVPFSESEPNFHGLRVVGSCNGLICLVGFGDRHIDRISISNPFTRSCRKLPDPVDYSRDTAVGFGFVPKLNQYKVVTIRNIKDHRDRSYRAEVSVFTLGTGVAWRWRVVHTLQCKVIHWVCPKQVLVNDALHWMVTRRFNHNQIHCRLSSIIAFGVASEMFRQILSPGRVLFEDWPSLGVLNGCLSLTGFARPYNAFADVWVMNKYGDRDSWHKHYSVRFPNLEVSNRWIVGTICRQKDGQVLMLYHLGVLVAYNVRTRTIRMITFDEVQLPFKFDVIEHVPTLVSPWNF